jgi:hypothetical protein
MGEKRAVAKPRPWSASRGARMILETTVVAGRLMAPTIAAGPSVST